MNIHLLSLPDWEALYIDGKLVMEGHSLPLVKALQLLQNRGVVQTVTEQYIDEEGIDIPDQLGGGFDG
jgi:hypothetical protein